MAKRMTTIRWSVEKAASEFQIDRKTLSKRIRGGDIQPGSDGKFSTEQICAAVFGDYRREQLREMRERADKLELENQVTRSERIPIEDVLQVNNECDLAIRGVILASKLPKESVNEIFYQLRAAGDAIARQTNRDWLASLG
jgi:hypothetical protein